MKYIILSGKRDAGKSTTIDTVCKRLSPSKVMRLKWDKTFEVIELDAIWANGTYLLEVDGCIIIAVSGSPTEQKLTITEILKICENLGIAIDILIVAMRSYEQRLGHNTPKELIGKGECLLHTMIDKIEGEDFKESAEWIERIETITKLISANIEELVV